MVTKKRISVAQFPFHRSYLKLRLHRSTFSNEEKHFHEWIDHGREPVARSTVESVFPRRRVGRVHSAVPSGCVIIPLGRRMHYEITADKSVLHSRGQSTAFMNENLYYSLANRTRSFARLRVRHALRRSLVGTRRCSNLLPVVYAYILYIRLPFHRHIYQLHLFHFQIVTP